MAGRVDHIAGHTFHARRGAIRNAFRYRVDYLLFDAEAALRPPWPLRRGAGWLMALDDRAHGGAPGAGRGAAWLRERLAAEGLAHHAGRIELLAQPRVMGHVFNPVSFWLVRDALGELRIVVPEVTNTYGDRHAYLCHRDDLGPIGPRDRLAARKTLHVSPFQDVAGDYAFAFDIGPDAIAIRIEHRAGGEGVVATLAGPRRAATTRALVAALLRRPFGARRVLALIHWQAARLWWKGARFRPRPAPPAAEISR